MITGRIECRACRRPLITCYPGQRLHPSCDPNPPGWTAAQLAEWGARVDARKARERAAQNGRTGLEDTTRARPDTNRERSRR